eukprot:GILJ01008469.1.p1 GENE.GILJ01008469.1~~GILJ01008469.1.p1  ORF type:complete len:414 (+),score=47.01 GILJ01008469.1:92-1333(+)
MVSVIHTTTKLRMTETSLQPIVIIIVCTLLCLYFLFLDTCTTHLHCYHQLASPLDSSSSFGQLQHTSMYGVSYCVVQEESLAGRLSWLSPAEVPMAIPNIADAQVYKLTDTNDDGNNETKWELQLVLRQNDGDAISQTSREELDVDEPLQHAIWTYEEADRIKAEQAALKIKTFLRDVSLHPAVERSLSMEFGTPFFSQFACVAAICGALSAAIFLSRRETVEFDAEDGFFSLQRINILGLSLRVKHKPLSHIQGATQERKQVQNRDQSWVTLYGVSLIDSEGNKFQILLDTYFRSEADSNRYVSMIVGFLRQAQLRYSLQRAEPPSQFISEPAVTQPTPSTSSSSSSLTTSSQVDSTPGAPESRSCCICYEVPSTVVFLPCRHVCTCLRCSDRVRSCPLCRNPIQDKIQLFF